MQICVHLTLSKFHLFASQTRGNHPFEHIVSYLASSINAVIRTQAYMSLNKLCSNRINQTQNIGLHDGRCASLTSSPPLPHTDFLT